MYLDKFMQELKQYLGENLVSAVQYGSTVKGEHVLKRSDINVMVILKNLTLKDINSVAKIVRYAQTRFNLNPVFWSEEELQTSIDVFPIEFQDILSNHKVLYGKDLFNNISVDTKNLRHQIEFELRSKLLKLRNEWLNVKDSKLLMHNLLSSAGTSFLHIFSYAQGIASGKLQDSLGDPFRVCVRLKKKEIKYGRKELENLYQETLDSVGKIISVINNV